MFSIVENIIKTKNKAFIAQDEEAVKALYDMTRTIGKWACEHEIKRIRYLKTGPINRVLCLRISIRILS